MLCSDQFVTLWKSPQPNIVFSPVTADVMGGKVYMIVSGVGWPAHNISQLSIVYMNTHNTNFWCPTHNCCSYMHNFRCPTHNCWSFYAQLLMPNAQHLDAQWPTLDAQRKTVGHLCTTPDAKRTTLGCPTTNSGCKGTTLRCMSQLCMIKVVHSCKSCASEMYNFHPPESWSFIFKFLKVVQNMTNFQKFLFCLCDTHISLFAQFHPKTFMGSK